MRRVRVRSLSFLVRVRDRFGLGTARATVRDRSPPLTPADGHHRCFWLRHRLPRATCARRHQASTPVRPTSGLLCGRLLAALVESVLRPGGWENMCRLLCHCVCHISLDSKYGRSFKTIHSLPPALGPGFDAWGHSRETRELAGAVGEGATPCTDGRPSENTPPWTGSHQSSLPNAAKGYPPREPREHVKDKTPQPGPLFN